MHYFCVLAKKVHAPDNHAVHRCKHINAARDYMLNQTILGLAKLDKNIREDLQA
jgi:hypothetical protein